MRSILSSLLVLVALLVSGCVALLFIPFVFPQSISQTVQFPAVERQVIYNVDDAGTADLDGDGLLDRWTTNHSAAQWIALHGKDSNQSFDLGLAQDETLPGFEQGELPVPYEKPMRVYMDDTRFVIDASGDDELLLSGTLTVPWNITAQRSGDANVQIDLCDEIPRCHRASFEVRDGGRIWIEPVPAPSDGFKVYFELDAATDLELVQLGALALTPEKHKFTYTSRDRHGVAMGDPDHDGLIDIFVSRGAVRGEVDIIEPGAQDEWFEWDGAKFVSRLAGTGIDKDGCPGRQAGWADIDGNHLLDLYQVCGRSLGPGQNRPNRLYLQTEAGQFTESAAEFGLDFSGSGSFRFFQHAYPDAPRMMAWATPAAFELFVQDESGKFAKVWSVARRGGPNDQITFADLNGDGIWEAMVLRATGNLLVDLQADSPKLLDPGEFGLPIASADGLFFHANGDGLLDFFAVPQGLFLGREGGHFEASQVLDVGWLGEDSNVRFAWFDKDADGDLDLWVLKRNGGNTLRPVRSIYNRAPQFVRDFMENWYGVDALRNRYWLAIVYENRFTEDRIQTLMVTDERGFDLPAGTPVEVKVSADGTISSRVHLTGEMDSARMSRARVDVVVPLPAGAEIMSARPIMP